ncbi:4Fe-4S dicluster domain-containing protein [uncultured Veillonella sp.]|uniref:4Fe-4S dicluster domain-containing protein n=1 Tax=uncultured Veillonella sp. TaxID=159268 RepID=UPI0025F0714E|nr:4Fe-4S dicluster domain-containing protein [uncultured Veillonella sp.]
MNQFVFCDVDLCIGCGMCERQCIMAHHGLKMTEVKLDDPLQRARCKAYRLPDMKIAVHCRHCENAPCMKACPVNAISKRNDNMIFVDEDVCIGCRECVLACPFGAVRMAPLENGRTVATKCDLCIDTEAGTPACITGCPKKALTLVTEDTIKALIQHKRETFA